jgi:hypothetical protein
MAAHDSSTPIGVGGPHCLGWPLIGRDDVLNKVAAASSRGSVSFLYVVAAPSR